MVEKTIKTSAKVGILGGGLAGVTLQHFLKLDSEILEKEDRPGGLCRSWTAEGVVADRGPHILFSRDKDTLREMTELLGDNIERHFRRNSILYSDRFVKYPFENDLYSLDPEDRYRCLKDFIFNPYSERKVNNLEDWALRMFGPYLARAYFLPYNEKIWKHRARELGTEWVERIPQPSPEELIKSAVGVPTEGYLHQLYFYHPRQGGIEALVKALMGDTARVRTNSAVTGLQREDGIWRVSTESGDYRYEHVVGCLPIRELIKVIDPPPPPPVRQVAESLKINGLILILMIYPSSEPCERLAVYIPDKEVWPHRISWVNYLGSHLVPAGYLAVLAEITTNQDHFCSRMSDDEVARETVKQLKKIKLLPESDSIEAYVHREDYGYVVNTRGYSAAQKTLRDYCRGLGIPLLGRWAEHEYLNIDAVWVRAKRLATELAGRWGKNNENGER